MEHTFTEFTAKTSEEAIEKGLKALSCAREDAIVVVLEEGKKRLFGWKNARVQIALKDEPKTLELHAPEGRVEDEVKTPVNAQNKAKNTSSDGERAVEFLNGLFSSLGFDAKGELKEDGDTIVVNVESKKIGEIIGKRGAVLDAVQTLCGAVANTGNEEYKRVVVDCGDYRERREETLKKLAENLADKAVRLERKIKLEPMSSYERRVIHAALTGREDIKTKSEGKEPFRYVVIVPSNAQDLPPIPARENSRGGNNRGRSGNGRGGNYRGGRGGDFKRGGRGGNGGNRSGGAKKATSLDFFGTFLGNSGNKHEE